MDIFRVFCFLLARADGVGDPNQTATTQFGEGGDDVEAATGVMDPNETATTLLGDNFEPAAGVRDPNETTTTLLGDGGDDVEAGSTEEASAGMSMVCTVQK